VLTCSSCNSEHDASYTNAPVVLESSLPLVPMSRSGTTRSPQLNASRLGSSRCKLSHALSQAPLQYIHPAHMPSYNASNWPSPMCSDTQALVYRRCLPGYLQDTNVRLQGTIHGVHLHVRRKHLRRVKHDVDRVGQYPGVSGILQWEKRACVICVERLARGMRLVSDRIRQV
jgi:hypothetical protein